MENKGNTGNKGNEEGNKEGKERLSIKSRREGKGTKKSAEMHTFFKYLSECVKKIVTRTCQVPEYRRLVYKATASGMYVSLIGPDLCSKDNRL